MATTARRAIRRNDNKQCYGTLRFPSNLGKPEYSLLSVLLARHKFIHDRVFQNVRRQHSLTQHEIVKRLLIEVVTKLQFRLGTQGLHFAVAVIVGGRLPGHAADKDER